MSDSPFNSQRFAIESGSKLPNVKNNFEPETVLVTPSDAGFGKFAGPLAHEFNNLLTVIRGYAQDLMTDGGLDGAAREALEQIDQAAKRATGLTAQMLALSRTKPPQREYLDLNEVVAQFGKISRPLTGRKITLLIQHCGGSLGIHADRAMIEEVLANLVNFFSNEARTSGKIWIRAEEVRLSTDALRNDSEARAGRFACITIKDNSTEPFSNAFKSSQSVMFAAIDHVVKQHEGWMEIENEAGRGTMFRIFLPLISELCFEASPRWSNLPLTRGHETILLVEGEDTVRSLAAEILNRHGYQVIEARSSDEAIAMLKKQTLRVDLLLADRELAERPNAKLFAELQRLFPDLRTIYTGGCNTDSVEHNRATESKFSFLQKPYSPHDLVNAVRRHLDTPNSMRKYPSALLSN